MSVPLVVVLSGPEKTRAKAEIALEKARLTIIPPNEWPINRKSYSAEHWSNLTPLRSGQEPDEDHGFLAVLAETEAAFHAAYGCVEKHGWVLRVHHELPEQPQKNELTALLEQYGRRLANLESRLPVPPMMGGALESPPWATQAGTFSAEQTRRATFAPFARTSANAPGIISGGLLSSTDCQLTNAVSGLVANVSTGEAIIPGNEGGAQGGYYARVSSTTSVTLATASGSNPRVDMVCLTVADAGYTIPSGGTSGAVTVQAVTGTPTSGASLSNLSGAPSLPASSLLLGYVLVPTSATNLISADIKNVATQARPGLYIPGRTLATTTYNPGGSGATYATSSATQAVIDGTNLVASITAPTSGNVRFSFESLMAASASGALVMTVWNQTASAEYSSALRVNMIQQASGMRLRYDALVTGLTPGTTYSLGPGFATSLATNAVTVYAGATTAEAGPAWLEIASA